MMIRLFDVDMKQIGWVNPNSMPTDSVFHAHKYGGILEFHSAEQASAEPGYAFDPINPKTLRQKKVADDTIPIIRFRLETSEIRETFALDTRAYHSWILLDSENFDWGTPGFVEGV